MLMLCRCTGVLILQSGEFVIQHDQRKEEAEEEEKFTEQTRPSTRDMENRCETPNPLLCPAFPFAPSAPSPNCVPTVSPTNSSCTL